MASFILELCLKEVPMGLLWPGNSHRPIRVSRDHVWHSNKYHSLNNSVLVGYQLWNHIGYSVCCTVYWLTVQCWIRIWFYVMFTFDYWLPFFCSHWWSHFCITCSLPAIFTCCQYQSKTRIFFVQFYYCFLRKLRAATIMEIPIFLVPSLCGQIVDIPWLPQLLCHFTKFISTSGWGWIYSVYFRLLMFLALQLYVREGMMCRWCNVGRMCVMVSNLEGENGESVTFTWAQI